MNPRSRRIRWLAVFSVLTIVEPTAPVDVWCLMVRFAFSRAKLTPQSWGSSAIFQVKGLQRPPGGWKVSKRVGSRDRSLVTSTRATQHLSKDFFFLILERFCLKIIPQSTKCKNYLGMKGEKLQAGRVWHDLCAILCACSVVSDCNPMDCSPPGSFDHGIYQARILEWVAIFSSRGSWHDLWLGQKQRNYLDSSVDQKPQLYSLVSCVPIIRIHRSRLPMKGV